MSMKTILIPMENQDVRSVLETALLLARRCDSYMEGFALQWQINGVFGADLLGDSPLENYNRGDELSGPSAEHLIRYLQRNSIRAGLRTVELNGANAGEIILRTAKSLKCDLLIKGAYTPNRLRQIVFGGATQHILANAPLPVLLAH